MSSRRVCFASARLGNHWGVSLNICSLLWASSCQPYEMAGCCPCAGRYSRMTWGERETAATHRRECPLMWQWREPWLIAPMKGCQKGKRASDHKGPEMGLGSGDNTLRVLPHPLSGPQLSIYKTQMISKHSPILLGNPLQNVAPVHIDFADSILIKYILHSGLKCL